jgi:hypothetical protein
MKKDKAVSYGYVIGGLAIGYGASNILMGANKEYSTC